MFNQKEYWAEYYKTHKDKLNKAKKLYAQTPQRKEYEESSRRKELRRKNQSSLKGKECQKKYRKENQEKISLRNKLNGNERAKWTIRDLIKKGRLLSLSKNYILCIDCGSRATDYDHRDYNKPLEVEPVCQSCNLKRGRAIPVNKEISCEQN